MIRFDGVEVAVPLLAGGTKTLLHDVDLTLGERRVSVVGPNGSGKSTLLRLLNGLVLPSTGNVTVDGLDTRQDGAAVRRRVGFVFSDPLSQLVMSTPVEDVELSLRRTVQDRRLRRARALELLAERGLTHVAEQSVYELSGGERQQVAMTSVLAVEPAVLVADEPTTLLDLRHRNRLVATLESLDQQLVYATHDLGFARRAERCLYVDGGTVVADGSADEVVTAYERAHGGLL